MANKYFTDLDTAPGAQLSDVICAVQGYVSPSMRGISYKQTLQQVYDLFKSSMVRYNTGNPNGQLAGSVYELCWDTLNHILWVCTTTGSDITSIWTKSISLVAGTGITIQQSGDNIEISSSSSASTWTEVTSTSVVMEVNSGYKANNSSRVSLALPAASIFGQQISVVGFGAGGWRITQGTGQKIIIGSISSSVGTGGYVESENIHDSLTIVCMEDNLTWQCLGAPQGNLTIL